MEKPEEKSEDLFRDVCENAHDLIQSVSPDGRFLYVNRAWRDTLGYTAEEAGRLRMFDIIHPDSQAHCRHVMQQLQSGETVAQFEAFFRAKDGRRIPVEGSATSRFENGQMVATRGIFRDISKRKHFEDELDRLFNLSLDMMCIAGTDGFFKEINPAFERVLGYTREELLSRSFVEFVHPDDRAGTLQEVENLAKGEMVIDFQNRYLAKDGTYRWLDWRSAPLAEQGLIYAVARDVTEEKRNQELMARQAVELERSNADLEQFAYVASHDLQAPLRAIRNLAEWIGEDLREGSRDLADKHLELLRDRSERMETLILDLLRYSRAGRLPEEISEVDTGALVREVADLLSPPQGFTVRVSSEMPKLKTAKAPLEQVLRNLIGNAIKHQDRPRGTVEVSARERGKFFEFSVADDGPGIPPEHHERVFLMFQKLKSRDRVAGSGIGLALVKRIVERQGGQVKLESGGGRGATFRFTWPKQLPKALPRAKPA